MSVLKSASNYFSCSLHEAVKIRATDAILSAHKPKTIPEFFTECCRKYKNRPALGYEVNANENLNSSKLQESVETPWSLITYGEYEVQVEQAALALLYLGVPARTSIGILAFNCPEWFYLQMAALRINAVSAGIYLTNSAEAVFHVLETSDASVVIVDDTQQLKKVRAIKMRLPKLLAVVQLHGPYDFTEADQRDGYYRWCDLAAMQFDGAARAELVAREREVAANDCALLIFTSGTVGMPKGCMISHDAILHAAYALAAAIPNASPGNEIAVSFLPLNHIAAQVFEIFANLVLGSLVYFADRNALKGTISKTFKKARPTLITSVPRVFEKIHENLTEDDGNSWALVDYITATARDTILRYHLDRMEGKTTSNLKRWFASYAIQRIKIALGFDRLKMIMIGGAPLSEELKRFFLSLDMPLCEIYGMSEVSGPVTLNMQKLMSAGRPLNGYEVKIQNPDQNGVGEILVRSRSSLMGYLKEPEKTKETLTEDGWVCSGDIGYIDVDGTINISGRLKELIITSGGIKIPPVYIENLIKKELPCISNAVVIGDRRKYLTVLVTFKTHIDPDTGYPLDSLLPETTEWLADRGLQYTQVSKMLQIKLTENLKDFDPSKVDTKPHKLIQTALEDGIKRVNQQAISNAHKVQYVTVLPHNFSVATNELGPTLKLRRNIILSKYSKFIEQMY